jgi:hypothetical protein
MHTEGDFAGITIVNRIFTDKVGMEEGKFINSDYR